jgi:hypothetical protein
MAYLETTMHLTLTIRCSQAWNAGMRKIVCRHKENTRIAALAYIVQSTPLGYERFHRLFCDGSGLEGDGSQIRLLVLYKMAWSHPSSDISPRCRIQNHLSITRHPYINQADKSPSTPRCRMATYLSATYHLCIEPRHTNLYHPIRTP